jgi:uncharacterized membrane protein YfcA
VTFGISLVAGALGSLLGLGGGIIIVPALTLLLNVDIRFAVGASIVAVIATSSAAAATYVKNEMANIKIAMLLEIATVSGALTGGFVAGIIPAQWLYAIFGIVMSYTALMMLRKSLPRRRAGSSAVRAELPSESGDRLARILDLRGHYSESTGEPIEYRVRRTPLGLCASYVAGIVSGLLGVGGGAIKVPVMNLLMDVPLKVATATSNFMIGVTAAGSAGIYYLRGDIHAAIAAPVASGVLVGATLGSKLMSRIHSRWIQVLFVAVLLWISLQMLWKGFHL